LQILWMRLGPPLATLQETRRRQRHALGPVTARLTLFRSLFNLCGSLPLLVTLNKGLIRGRHSRMF
jgi:hypothetical protein